MATGQVIGIDLPQPGELPARILANVHDVGRPRLEQIVQELRPIGKRDPRQQTRQFLGRHAHEPNRRQPAARIEPAPFKIAERERGSTTRLSRFVFKTLIGTPLVPDV